MNYENDSFYNIVKERKIDYLVHFTKSSNLPFIFGDDESRNGILSSDQVAKYFGKSSIWDKKRLDNRSDYVCCSVQRLNKSYYQRRIKEERDRGDIFNQWVTIFIDPKVVTSSSLFCPVNAATGNGRYIQSGMEGFESIFSNEVTGRNYRGAFSYIRPSNMPSNFPTNYQAEVLIKDRIPKSALLGIAFPDDSIKVEKERLKFWSTNNIPVLNWQTCIEGYGNING